VGGSGCRVQCISGISLFVFLSIQKVCFHCLSLLCLEFHLRKKVIASQAMEIKLVVVFLPTEPIVPISAVIMGKCT
jgi:hypothetical protein